MKAARTDPSPGRWPTRQVAAATLLFASTALASLWPVLTRAGWPSNHEGLAFRFRTLVYAFHFAQGDLLPIWSSEDFNGLGTPMPFYYHKLFYVLSGAFYALVPDMKASLVFPLLALLIAGSLGLYRTLLRLDVSHGCAVAVAATLPFQGYTLCDWLVRGAMAEFAACMIVPWLLFSVVDMIRESRIRWHLYASLFLLALAHSVVAYFGALLAGVGVAFALAGIGRARLRTQALRAGLFGAVWIAAVSPLLLVRLRLQRHYGVGAITSGLYDPARHLQGFVSGQIWSGSWSWGHSDRWSPVQLNPETSLFFLVAVAGIVLCWRRAGLGRDRIPRALAFLLVALGLFCFLQLPVAAPLYAWIPGFRYVQFPWRLMAIEQALVLSLLGLGFGAITAGRQRLLRGGLPGLFLIASLVANRSFHPIEYAWFAAGDLKRLPAAGEERGVPGLGEYLPTVELGDEEDAPAGRLARYAYALGHPQAQLQRMVSFSSAAERRSCTGAAMPRARPEPLELRFTVACVRPATAILRHNFSGLERVYVASGDGWRRVDAVRTPRDPRIRLGVPAGETQIRVLLPRLGYALLP